MMAYLAVALSIAIIVVSLWVRRLTWRCRWESAITLAITLQAATLLLCSPVGSLVGLRLRLPTLLGHSNMIAHVGHLALLLSATLVAGHVLAVLIDDEQFRWQFRQYCERPTILAIPLLQSTFVMSVASTDSYDVFAVPPDAWLQLYWIILFGLIIWMLSYAVRALVIIRRDSRFRSTATNYLVGCIIGIATCVWRIIATLSERVHALTYGEATWVGLSLAAAVFAVASARSWRRRMREFYSAPNKKGGDDASVIPAV